MVHSFLRGGTNGITYRSPDELIADGKQGNSNAAVPEETNINRDGSIW